MTIPTEPIDSIPRPQDLIDAMSQSNRGEITREAVEAITQDAISDTIRRFEATGSPVITDGEQSKPSFATYSVHGAANIAPDGMVIPFEDGHTRQLPRLTATRHTALPSTTRSSFHNCSNSTSQTSICRSRATRFFRAFSR